MTLPHAKKKGLHGDEANLRAPPHPSPTLCQCPYGNKLCVQTDLDSNPLYFQGLNFIWDIFPKGNSFTTASSCCLLLENTVLHVHGS